MQATIKAVSPKPRVWDGPKGALHFINVVFEDGSAGDYGAKPETSQQHIEALQALVGKPGDFELEPKPDYEGQKQFKIKSYPGQTIGKGFGGGGGKNFVPSWNQTEDGARYHEERTDRRTALMQAMGFAIAKPPGDGDPGVLALADHLYDWLRAVDQKPVQTSPVTQREAVAGEPMRETAQVQTPGVRTINEGPDKCACGAPVGKPHASKCQGVS